MNLTEKCNWYIKKFSYLSDKCEILKISGKCRWKKKTPARSRGGSQWQESNALYATPTSSSRFGIEGGFSPSGYLGHTRYGRSGQGAESWSSAGSQLRSTVRSHWYDTQLAPMPEVQTFPRSIIRLFFIILRPPIRSDPRMHLLFTLSRLHRAPQSGSKDVRL